MEDGRFFLQAGKQKYDLITGEPPPPANIGVVNLYSQEYFQLIYDHLQEGGIVTYWLPVDQLTVSSAKSILKAFCNVFQDCSLWTGTAFDWVMIGTRNANRAISEKQFSRQWHESPGPSDLRWCGFEEPAQLGTTFLMDSLDLKKFTGRSLPVVDDFPHRILGEPGFQLSEFAEIMDTAAVRERFARSPMIRNRWPESLRTKTSDFFWVQGIFNKALFKPFKERIAAGHQNPGLSFAELHEIFSRTSLRITPLWMMGDEFPDIDRVANSLTSASRGIFPDAYLFLGSRAMADRDFLLAANYFAKAQKTNPDLVTLRVYSLCMAGQVAAARSLIRDTGVVFDKPDKKAFLSWLNRTFRIEESGP